MSGHASRPTRGASVANNRLRRPAMVRSRVRWLLAQLLALALPLAARGTSIDTSPVQARLLSDSTRFITQDSPNSLALYRVSDGQLLQRFPVSEFVNDFDVTSDERLLVVTYGNGGIGAWSVATDAEAWWRSAWVSGLGYTYDVSLSQNGKTPVQFRQVEILSGLSDPQFVAFLRQENVTDVHDAMDRRLAEPSLREAMHAAIEGSGFDLGRSDGTGEPDEPKLDAALLRIYREMEPRPMYHLLEHDQLMRLWRVPHVMKVERVIGMKIGTGGSTGARYLHGTTQRRFFPELWKVRGELAPEGF